jgi:hypothetical protein
MASNPSSRSVSITGVFYAPTIVNFILGTLLFVTYMPKFMKARDPMAPMVPIAPIPSAPPAPKSA